MPIKKKPEKVVNADTNRFMHRYVPWENLDEPPRHEKGAKWTEEQAIAEFEWLLRYIASPDPSKVFMNQAAFHRGYTEGNFFSRLAKQFAGKCLDLLDMVKLMTNEKIAMLTLNKFYDARFGIFASQNVSKKSSDPWRQDAKVNMVGSIQIVAKDYKGIKPDMHANLDKKMRNT